MDDGIGIDMRKMNGLLQKLADLRIDMAIYAVSKYDENTKFNMLVMCLNNIKTHIENNKDKKDEILNILQLFRTNEVFKFIEGFQRKSNTSTAGGGSGSGSRSGSDSGERERKRKGSRSSKRSTSPSANAPSLEEQKEVLANGMRALDTLRSPSNTPRSNDSTTQLVASAVTYQQAVQANQMEQKKFAATMMGNTSDAAKQLVNSAEIRVKNAHENLSKLIDKLNDEEKKILERVEEEYNIQVKELEAKYQGNELELKQRKFTERVCFFIGLLPGGLAGQSFGGAITAGLVGITAMGGNMLYNIQNVLSSPFYSSPCLNDPYHPIAVPTTTEANCTPGMFYGQTCTSESSYNCVSSDGMTFGTEHFAMIAGITGALFSGLVVWIGSRFVRGQSKLSEMPSGVVGTITAPIHVAWRIFPLGTIIESIRESDDRQILQQKVLAGPGAWREEHKMVDRMVMIDKAMKTWSEGMQKHYLANIKHAQEQLKDANDKLKEANQLAHSVVVETLQASKQMLLQDTTPHPLPSYPRRQLEGGKRINKTHRKRKTGQKVKTHQKRNIRQNRKTRQKRNIRQNRKTRR